MADEHQRGVAHRAGHRPGAGRRRRTRSPAIAACGRRSASARPARTRRPGCGSSRRHRCRYAAARTPPPPPRRRRMTSRPCVYAGFHGLRVMPCSGQSPGDFQPNSVVVVLPRITAPAAFSPTTIGASSGDRRRDRWCGCRGAWESRRDRPGPSPCTARRPAGRAAGRPASAPSLSPAASSARGFSTAKAFSAGVQPGDALGDGLQHLDRAERAAGIKRQHLLGGQQGGVGSGHGPLSRRVNRRSMAPAADGGNPR